MLAVSGLFKIGATVEDKQKQADLEAVNKFARELNVYLQVDWEDDGSLYLVMIYRRGIRGTGTKVMEKLIGFCDKYSVELRLIPEVDELVYYYKRFGFVEVDKGYSHWMYYKKNKAAQVPETSNNEKGS